MILAMMKMIKNAKDLQMKEQKQMLLLKKRQYMTGNRTP